MLPKSLQDVACWVQPGLCWPWTLFTQSCPTCRCKVVGWSASCWTGRKGNWRQREIECWNAKYFCAHGRTFGMKSRTTATQSLQYVVIWRSSNSRARTHKPGIQHPSVFTCIRWWHADRSGEPLGWQWWFKVISNCGHWPCCSAMSFPHCEDQQHDVDETILLHGTSWDNADSIVQNGFDNRICGRGMYGAWVYFASAGSKSHQNIMKLYEQLFRDRVELS